MSRDHIGFTLNVKVLANLLAQDPSCRQEMLEGIMEAANAPVPTTSQLGAANLTPGEGVEPTWCSVFAATVQGKQPGEAGLFYRNNTRGGDGTRIQMRIRRQPKRQQAATPGNVLPQGGQAPQVPANVTPERAAAILAQAGLGHLVAQVAGKTAPAPQPQQNAIPADIAALINNG